MSVTEDDLRPPDLMAAKADALQADIDFLLERRDQFVTVPCPACGGSFERSSFERGGFRYATCGACETLFMNPRAPEDVMHEFYAGSQNYAFWNEHIFPASEAARREHLFAPRARRTVDLCHQHGVTTGTLLEIGAAFGTFCEEIRALGDFERIIALEPTPDLAATCRARGLETIEAPVEAAPLPGGVDVVVAWEVIEHVHDPSAMLAAVHRVLRPGGLLILSCPNVKGFDMVVLGEAGGAIDHEHVNYFHPASLSLLLSRSSFDVVETLTPGQLDVELVRKRLLDGSLDPTQHPALADLLLDRFEQVGAAFQDLLSSSKLSSHQWAVARRR